MIMASYMLLGCLSIFYCLHVSAVDYLTPTPFPTPQPVKIDMKCDPNDKFADCPSDYCCVRDEFLPSYVYCKRLGRSGEGCTTKSYTQSSCPCKMEYYCKPNIISLGYQSLYGSCTKDNTVSVTKK